MSGKFIKNIENFVCGNCGFKVVGNGYTNHCPKCLWSRHVDVFPGDRAESCGGLMRPAGLRIENGKESIVHKCERCGDIRICRVSAGDARDEVLKVSQLLG